MKSGEIPLGGEISISKLIFKLKAIAHSLRIGGPVLMLLGMVFMVWIYAPLAYYQTRYSLSPKSRFGNELKEVILDKTYSLYIPKIDAKSVVIENVDVAKPEAYLLALQKGVAAAANLSRPGVKGTTFLFAHSVSSPLNFARYNAVFYLLDKMQVGDDVEIAYHGNMYLYKIDKVEILEANDLKYLIPQKDEERLVLQTCYPPGTTWKRLVTVAKRI
jgi:sortase A